MARSVDTHTRSTSARCSAGPPAHRGTAFVEIYQNCNVYNDGAFDYAKEPKLRSDALVEIEHGQPLVFGTGRDKGIRLEGLEPRVVPMDDGSDAPDLLVHDETAAEPILASVLARMRYPALPEAIGVLRAIERPTFDALVDGQIESARAREGRGDLAALLESGDTWTVA